MAGGRPTKCIPKYVDSICQQLAEGRSLRKICAQDDMPAVSSVLLWVVQGREVEGTGDEFSERYAQAREAAGYSHGDGVIEVVELVRSGEIDPQTAKAMMDGLKWAAERMAPKSHSAKQDINHTSSDGSMSPSVVILPQKE